MREEARVSPNEPSREDRGSHTEAHPSHNLDVKLSHDRHEVPGNGETDSVIEGAEIMEGKSLPCGTDPGVFRSAFADEDTRSQENERLGISR